MPIDIDGLTEADLIDLNHRIVERLRFLQQARTHRAMLRFRIGERVTFDDGGAPVVGVVTRYNKKSVSLVDSVGRRWTVAPQLLSPVDAPADQVVEAKRLGQG
ncbi:hypothetical protein [Pirellulimonas nuda]|nr:hypothetical protein [Pirellulimonas nuda]